MFIAALGVGQLSAQENEKGKWRKSYLNFGYISQTLDYPAVELTQDIVDILYTAGYDDDQFKGGKISSKLGGSLTYGRTFFLHKKPLGDMVRIGLDATFVDLSYIQYEDQNRTSTIAIEELSDLETQQAEFGMAFGPSVTIKPSKMLSIHTYFRYAPTYSLLYMNESLSGNLANYFVTGGAVSWGMIGVGIEARFGSCKYKDFTSGFLDSFEVDIPDTIQIPDVGSRKIKTSGMRAYLSLRF